MPCGKLRKLKLLVFWLTGEASCLFGLLQVGVGDQGLIVRVNRLHFHHRSVISGCGAERLPSSRSTEAGNGVWRDRGRVSVPAITDGCSWSFGHAK